MDKPTQGKWKTDLLGFSEHITDEYDNSIAQLKKLSSSENETNAKLIVALQNAAVEINPTNPEAVANKINELYVICRLISGSESDIELAKILAPKALSAIQALEEEK